MWFLGEKDAVDGRNRGTKCTAQYVLEVGAGEEAVVKVRFFTNDEDPGEYFSKAAFDDVFERRKTEADEFYSTVSH